MSQLIRLFVVSWLLFGVFVLIGCKDEQIDESQIEISNDYIKKIDTDENEFLTLSYNGYVLQEASTNTAFGLITFKFNYSNEQLISVDFFSGPETFKTNFQYQDGGFSMTTQLSSWEKDSVVVRVDSEDRITQLTRIWVDTDDNSIYKEKATIVEYSDTANALMTFLSFDGSGDTTRQTRMNCQLSPFGPLFNGTTAQRALLTHYTNSNYYLDLLICGKAMLSRTNDTDSLTFVYEKDEKERPISAVRKLTLRGSSSETNFTFEY